MVLAVIFLGLGLGSLWFGIRTLRPTPMEMEEFLTGETAESRRPALFEAAGPILGLIGTVLGVILFTGGILLAMLQL
jgi:hypothetical protein